MLTNVHVGTVTHEENSKKDEKVLNGGNEYEL